MKIGGHFVTNNGIKNIPAKAKELGCECFQFFLQPPHIDSASIPVLTVAESYLEEFEAECKKCGLTDFYVHAPYFINLASDSLRVRQESVNFLKTELKASEMIGAKSLVIHLGSSGGEDEKSAIKRAAESLKDILEGYNGKTGILMEIISGRGLIIGRNFKQIGSIISKLSGEEREKVGVCFDTCHVFVNGFDLRTRQEVEQTLKEFDREVGIEKIKLIHASDSQENIGSDIDKHECLGKGKIGRGAFWSLLHDSRLKDVDFIVESNCGSANDVEVLKGLRNADKP
ncbi:MAG: deoxyribonuclease IV [Patescibacteria group bacterium]|nr:deoxyribonuclease IV [Patescibacteria group bacterium]MDD5491005.1 deoxyribonuclease IV [Patescibacteria group bacterium]